MSWNISNKQPYMIEGDEGVVDHLTIYDAYENEVVALVMPTLGGSKLNAHMIVAAPDMTVAIREFLATWDTGKNLSAYVQALGDALARAEGRS